MQGRLTPEQGAEIFTGGLRVIEDAARSIGGGEVVNVCLHKPDVRGYERASLDRLLTASTPPSHPPTATPSSSSTRAARRW